MSFQRHFISFIFVRSLLKGLTQNELAEKSGISLRTIQRIERGEVNGR
jgi:transcriptional regulator with XRE-family HTH domain